MTKSNKTTTTKASARPAKATKRTKASDADRKAAVAQAQATDAAANVSAVNPDVVPLAEAMKPTTATKGSKAKTPKATKPAKAAKPKKTSGLDAAALVLKDACQPMGCKDMVETMLAKGMWKTDGKTPAATIYAAILREIQTKGGEARFKKTDRGLFTING